MPLIVTEVPEGPDVGFKLVIVGPGVEIVNATPLLSLSADVTTTFPVAAPLGTVTAMPVLLQLVTVAAIPLNATLLPP